MGVGGATGYALYKKPPNGIAIMLVAGGIGTIADFTLGMLYTCRPQALSWLEERRLQREERLRTANIVMEFPPPRPSSATSSPNIVDSNTTSPYTGQDFNYGEERGRENE